MVSIDSKYNGALTREQFLFYEMRTTARLMFEGVRKVFSKGAIVTSGKAITALYNFKDHWFAQGIEEECRDSLEQLFGSSDSVVIQAVPQMMQNSSSVGIEGNVNDGSLTITFFA